MQKGVKAESNYCMEWQPLEFECINFDYANETIAKTKITKNFTLNNESAVL